MSVFYFNHRCEHCELIIVFGIKTHLFKVKNNIGAEMNIQFILLEGLIFSHSNGTTNIVSVFLW